MKEVLVAAVAALSVVPRLQAGVYADGVVQYVPGTGARAGYDSPSAALGSPSVRTEDPDWGPSPVNPYSPPYLSSQIVSVGAGGSLTLSCSTPIRNNPDHPFGLDFLVFGASMFVITNGVYDENGVTDGSVYATASPPQSRVAVSQDNVTYYTLNPSLAPVVNGLFPTDGTADFQTPVNPALTGAAFAGQKLAGIRALYAGSAGGAGYDLGWAQDANGQPVSLESANFVRIEVLSGMAYVDGLAIVPEPSAWMILALGAVPLGLALWRRGGRAGGGIGL